MNPEEEESPINYYQHMSAQPDGLRFRLDAADVITRVEDELRGGVQYERNGVKTYYEERRMMNDTGISRVSALLHSIVNKVGHLTKYANEERVLRQVKAIVKSFIVDLTLNLKKWAPQARIANDGSLFNPSMDKVRNKRIVIQMIENAVHESMLRADGGFEASNLSKIWNVQEIDDRRSRERDRSGMFGGIFGRGGDNYG